MCFGFCCEDTVATQTIWTPSQPTTVITQSYGGGLDQTVISQPSYFGGGLEQTITSTPCYGGGLEQTVISSPSYGDGNLGESTVSTDAW